MKFLRLFAAIFIGLLFTQALSAQLFYKLKISVDSYSIGNVNSQKITKIFVHNSKHNLDLSLLAYKKKILLRLLDMGFTITDSRQNANFILSYDIFIKPIIKLENSSTYHSGSTSTITKTNEAGKKEEFEVEQSGTYLPVTEQTQIFKKTLSLKLHQKDGNRLIWQGESVIEDQNAKHAHHSNYLVYCAMSHFLKETNNHPQDGYYSRRHLRSIDEIYDIQRFMR